VYEELLSQLAVPHSRVLTSVRAPPSLENIYDTFSNGTRPGNNTGRKQATATEDFEFHISYLLS